MEMIFTIHAILPARRRRRRQLPTDIHRRRHIATNIATKGTPREQRDEQRYEQGTTKFH